MTTTEQYTIRKIMDMIDCGEIRIPILQRRYIWGKEQIVKLFSTVIDGNSFGAISAVKTTDDYKLFSSRTFVEDLKDKFALSTDCYCQTHDKNNLLYLILDGQQRLQSFYLGLTSKYDGVELYFNMTNASFAYLNECNNSDYISVKQLYKLLAQNNYEVVAQRVNKSTSKAINQNIFKFYYHFFYTKNIVILLTCPNKLNEKEDKLKYFELFKRLNTGGVNLDIYDICVSKLKAFNPKFEELFSKLEKEFNDQSYPFNYPFRRGNYSSFFPKHKSEVWIKILSSCFIKDIKIGWLLDESFEQDINTLLNVSFTVNTLFEFICLTFKIFRIINLHNAYAPSFIYYVYSLYSKNRQTDVKQFLVGYFKGIFQKYFIDDKSLELFTLRYIIINFIVSEEENGYVFHCKKINNIYEIQVNDKNSEGLHKFSVDIKHEIIGTTNGNIILKYSDEIIDKELSILSNSFTINMNNKENEIQKKWNKYKKYID